MEWLRQKNATADSIHAGRDREALRAACVEYLNGRLQFLLVAPERLAVAGFPQMLTKRKPALVAVEEAHRVLTSHREHSPEYDLLCAEIAALRPAAVLALTYKVTDSQQKEIAARLGLQL